MIISVIVAVGANGVIGNDRGLPWRLPHDLKRFKNFTWGKPVIMGRKTHELVGKPLVGRHNIILTHNPVYVAAGCQVAHSVEEALTLAGAQLADSRGGEVMIIGGAKVYEEFIWQCNRVYLTVVDGRFQGDAYLPLEPLSAPEWREIHQEICLPDEKNPHRHRFYILERVRNTR